VRVNRNRVLHPFGGLLRPLRGTCHLDRGILRAVFSDRTLSRFSMALPDRVLRALGRLNVPVYRLTGGRLMAKVGRAPVLLLTTTGRRSGQQRTAPVVYLADGDRLVVLGSNAGNERTPAWSLNLQANPDAEAEIRGERRPVRARVAEGGERAELWRRMTDQYGGFDDYRDRTARDIKLFVLEPR
jgi:deazaflavin-dependent oxidoreductase (nitroreductase family)